MKKFFSIVVALVATMTALVMGATGDALMAAGMTATDAQGNGDAGDGQVQSTNGGADGGSGTVTQGQQAAGEGGDGLYVRDVDEMVLKINPMSTPLLQVASYASSSDTDSQEFEYWSVGPRITRTTLVSDMKAAEQTGADRFKLQVADKGFVTKDDTIRVVGKKGWQEGSTSATPDGKEDLVLFVINVDEETGWPVCMTVNGKKTGAQGAQSFKLPYDLEAGQVLIRMGKSCGELDIQTGRFFNYPEPEIQYTQNFMFQVEQSTFDKLTAKKVKWDFNDVEQAGIADMKVAQENTVLFGVKRKIRHPNKQNLNQYFTGGLWWQAGKDLTIGHVEAMTYGDGSYVYGDEYGNVAYEDGTPFTSAGGSVYYDENHMPYKTSGAGHTTQSTLSVNVVMESVIKDDDLVTFARKMFVGAAGNKKKVLVCGSKILEKFGQIKSDRFRLKETVEVWDLTFNRFHTDFGDVMAIYDEQFDMNGMSAYGFCIDPDLIKKKVFRSMTQVVLDLIKSGQRNAEAKVIQEVVGYYLQFRDAHARVQLAGNDGALDWETAAKFDYHAAAAAVPPKYLSYNGTDAHDKSKQTVEENTKVTA